MHHIHLKYQIKILSHRSIFAFHFSCTLQKQRSHTCFPSEQTLLLLFYHSSHCFWHSFSLTFIISHSLLTPHHITLYSLLLYFFLPLLGSFIISYVPIIYFVNHSTLPFFLAQSDVLFCFSLSAPIPKRDGLFWACYISIVSLLIADWQTLIYVMRWCGLNRMESNFLTW